MVEYQPNEKTTGTTVSDNPKRKISIISYKDLLEKDIQPIEYFVDEIIPKSALVYVYGPPGSFKTNFLLYLSLRGSQGDNIFEFDVKEPFKTVWIDEENRDIGMKDKLRKLSTALMIKPEQLTDNVFMISNNFNILFDRGLLEEVIKKFKPDIVVVDSIAKVFPLNEREEKDVKKIFSALNPLMSKYHVTFILIHHCRKLFNNQTSRGMEDISGSREFSAMADSMVYLEDMGGNKFMLKQTKNRYSSKCSSLNFEVFGNKDELSLLYLGKVVDKYNKKMQEYKEEIRKWINSQNCKEFKRGTIMGSMKEAGFKSERNLDYALKNMVEKNELSKSKKFGYYDVVKIE